MHKQLLQKGGAPSEDKMMVLVMVFGPEGVLFSLLSGGGKDRESADVALKNRILQGSRGPHGLQDGPLCPRKSRKSYISQAS
ncbi:hypothetical protein FGO68_gene10811 [Halteria grandinella]|uniref:Uncharacterized protein n=1 Tax=Halteria grandinella TaxID=5974 RepID=A0A8J8NVF8_HALGN|nr:hypothetical protein FGO68_gene10811 [Halteria grandinella]